MIHHKLWVGALRNRGKTGKTAKNYSGLIMQVIPFTIKKDRIKRSAVSTL